MNTTERERFRATVLEEIRTLEETIGGLSEQTGPVEPDVAIGRLSRLDTMLSQGINEASIAKGRTRIRKLKLALERLEDDEDFGLCAECGEPIPMARLLAVPESAVCVDCAE